MASLKLADRQIVEIVKALARRARLIVLDEPTASLSDHESRVLFEILSDRVDVFRNGELVASVPPSATTPAQLIGYMLGGEREDVPHSRRSVQAAQPALAELKNWTRDGLPSLSQVNLRVGEHEVVGLYGLRGSGTELIAEGLAGLHPEIAGELVLGNYHGRAFGTPVRDNNAPLTVQDAPDLILEYNGVDGIGESLRKIFDDAKIPFIAVNVPVPGGTWFNLVNTEIGADTANVVVPLAKAKGWSANDTTVLIIQGSTAGVEVDDCVGYFMVTAAQSMGMPEVKPDDNTALTTTIGTSGIQVDGKGTLEESYTAVKNALQTVDPACSRSCCPGCSRRSKIWPC
jgi:energy-coupling factor transporter ATP-binding protein EcfA2